MLTRRDLLRTLSFLLANSIAKQNSLASPLVAPEEDLTQYVNPMIGTGGHGHTYPGATVPFGMVQLSPDNGVNGWDWCSGYNYYSNEIVGFSHTHLSGTGIGDMLDVAFMPSITKGNEDVKLRSRFSHNQEKVEAGYYAVKFLDNEIDVRLTATKRAAFHSYQFPHISLGQKAVVTINLAHAFNWDRTTEADIQVEYPSVLSGYRKSTGWAKNQTVYFVARFSRPFTTNLIIRGARGTGKIDHIHLYLDTQSQDNKPILVKVGISATSIEAAKKNLETEIPHWDFERTRNEAKEAWQRELQKVKLKTDDRKLKTIFYTALYHAYLAPTLFNDADGSYRGADGKIHQARFDNYTTFSLWDTFRAAHPLYTILQPERADAMVQSLMAFYREHGLLPVWSLMGNETNTMIGYHSAPVIVDAIQKGLTRIDEREAFEAMKKSALNRDRGLQYYQMPEPTTIEKLYKTLERSDIKPIENQKPFKFPENFVAGYAKTIGGNTIGYHSAHANVNQALIARTTKGKDVIEWETASFNKQNFPFRGGLLPVKLSEHPTQSGNSPPLNGQLNYLQANNLVDESKTIAFVWLGGIDVDENRRRFDFYVNNEKWFEFHSPKDASQTSFQVKSPNGATLNFYATHIDRFGDFFGYMTLTVPIEVLKTESLRLKVIGANENDDDWFMTFEHSLGNRMTISNVYALVDMRDKFKSTPSGVDKNVFIMQVTRLDIENADAPCRAKIKLESAKAPKTNPSFPTQVGADIQIDLKAGLNSFFIPLTRSNKNEDYKLKLTKESGRVLNQTFTLRPVKPFNYIPADLENESVSKTLEYAYDDWCIAQLAKKLNRQDDYKLFTERSQFYRNLFDKETGFMRGKLADGSWRVPFSPRFSQHRQDDYTEGNAWQYSWFIPHDVDGMVELFGGKKSFIKKLDQLFAESSSLEGANASPDITGLIGQYAHGNEPSHHIAYLYTLAGGAHHKTENIVRQITSTLYNDTPEGLCGNEDCGQMSAWYIFSALGFYPVNPASSLYVIGTPHFEKAEIDVGNGKTFTVIANRLSDTNRYVQSVTLNGKPLRVPLIKHSDIMNGGMLVFEMGSKASENLFSKL